MYAIRSYYALKTTSLANVNVAVVADIAQSTLPIEEPFLVKGNEAAAVAAVSATAWLSVRPAAKVVVRANTTLAKVIEESGRPFRVVWISYGWEVESVAQPAGSLT